MTHYIYIASGETFESWTWSVNFYLVGELIITDDIEMHLMESLPSIAFARFRLASITKPK